MRVSPGYNDDYQIILTGNWDMGKKTGQWQYFDDEGELYLIEIFDAGRFIKRRELTDGHWAEATYNELDNEEQFNYTILDLQPPAGPDNKVGEDD